MEFIRQHLPHFSVSSNRLEYNEETMRRVHATERAWDYFIRVHNPITEVPGMDDIIAFMLYRVAIVIPGDIFASRLKLQTFTGTELNLLVYVLIGRHGDDFELTFKGIRSNIRFKNAERELENSLGEKAMYVHARPIWFKDEERLIQATSSCDHGLQERALIRTLIRTGARGNDIKMVDYRCHVEDTFNFNNEPAILIRTPSLKNRRGDVVDTWISGDAYRDVKAWLDKRRTIFPDSPYLFVTTKGEQVSAESISMSFASLCEYAGYSPRFFSCHSGRMSFACRLSAKVFANGGTVADVYARAETTGLWATRSRSVERYCDISTRRYFDGEDGPLTWEEFRNLSPEILHGLSHLNPIMKKPNSWVIHNREYLSRLGRHFGRIFPDSARPYDIRRFIAGALLRAQPEIRTWLKEKFCLDALREVHSMRLVAVLMDLQLLTEGFSFSALPPPSEEMILLRLDFSDLSQGPLLPEENWPTLRARQVREVVLRDSDHEEYVRNVFERRVNDRSVTIGRRRDHTKTAIHANRREQHTTEWMIVSQLEQGENESSLSDVDEPVFPSDVVQNTDLDRLNREDEPISSSFRERVQLRLAQRELLRESEDIISPPAVPDVVQEPSRAQFEDNALICETPRRRPKRKNNTTPSTAATESRGNRD